jgi:hypothetical protein
VSVREKFDGVTNEAGLPVIEAITKLHDSDTTYLLLVEFKESTDVFVDSRGDQTKGQRTKFMQALYHHWSGQPKKEKKRK